MILTNIRVEARILRGTDSLGIGGSGDFRCKSLLTFFSTLLQDLLTLLGSDDIGCLFGFGADLFLHLAVVFNLFKDQLILLMSDVRVFSGLADDA